MDIERFKQIDICTVAHGLGISFKTATHAVCFNGHDKKTASLVFHKDTNQAHCYGCGFHGDTIELVEQVRRCSFMEAIHYLGPLAGETFHSDVHHVEDDHPHALEPFLPLEYHNQLLPADYDFFLKVKGLNAETLSDHLIGRYGNRYSIPIYGQGRVLLNIRLYSPSEEPKMLPFAKGFGSQIYGVDTLSFYDSVVLCEGEWDRLILLQNKIYAVTGTAGASTFKDDWVSHFAEKEVFICYDNDEPGRAGARLAAEKLVKVARSVKILTLPDEVGEKGDISDLFKLYRSEAPQLLEQLQKQAKPYMSTELLLPLSYTNSLAPDAVTQSAKNNYWAYPVSEFLNQEDTEFKYLVEDIIAETGIVIIHAKPKIGKSLLATNLAIAVAKGDEFLGKKCQQGHVLMLQLEDPSPQVRERLKLMGASEDDAMSIKVGDFKITEKQHSEMLDAFIKHMGVKLVVVDPFVFVHDADDENNSAKMAHVMQLFRNLALRYSICIVIVHHDRKSGGGNGDTIRGSGAIFSSCDLAIGMSPIGDGQVKVEFVSRNKPVEPMIIELDQSSLVWYTRGQIEEWKAAKDTDTLIQIFQVSPANTLRKLQEETGWGYRRIRRDLNKMISEGLIIQSVAEHNEAGRPTQLFTLKDKEAKMG